MLTCIACSKQLNHGGSLPQQGEEEEDNLGATLSTKQAIKSLTSQIKDVAFKASGAYKNCKPCSRSSNGNGERDSAESDTADSAKFHYSYHRTMSLNSTPRIWGKEMEARLKGMCSGEGTPASVSGQTESIVFTEEDEPQEWVAQVEPGVVITFVSLPQEEGNDLKRIRFSRDLFNKWQAQRWWVENYDKVMELYNVQRFNQKNVPFPTPPRSEDESSKIESAKVTLETPPLNNMQLPCNLNLVTGYSSSDSLDHRPLQSRHCSEPGDIVTATPKVSSICGVRPETSSIDGSTRTSSSREADCSGELSVSISSDVDTEWVEEDEPGVYITIRALPCGIRELRRVRFSREKFEEKHARSWWEENKARIQQQYL